MRPLLAAFPLLIITSLVVRFRIAACWGVGAQTGWHLALVDKRAGRRAACSPALQCLGASRFVQLANPIVILVTGIGWIDGRNGDSWFGWCEDFGPRESAGVGTIMHDRGGVVGAAPVDIVACDEVEVAVHQVATSVWSIIDVAACLSGWHRDTW